MQRPPEVAIERTLLVSSLGHHGDGIAIADDNGEQGRYFVPYTLPGERIRAKTVGKRAEVLEVLEPSPDRIEPFCPHFGSCGGCTSQHVGDLPYRAWKHGIVEMALNNKGLEVSVDDLIDAHGDGRRRVTFHVRFAKGRVQVGFMQPRSRELIDLENCPILVPELNDAAQIARMMTAPFASKTQQLDIAITATQDGLDCDIRGAGTVDYDIHVALAERAEACNIARVSIEGEMILERRKPTLRVGKVRVPLPPASFLQATAVGEETLARLVLSKIGGAKKVADLFCGVGLFALRLAPSVAVYAADSNETAIAALRDAVRYGEGLKPVEAEVRDLFRNPVYHDDLKHFDAVIFNPGRAGAEAQATEIALSTVPLVICVSCDPASLARDAKILNDGGYQFDRVTPVDQFKYSPHIESVAVFRQK